MGGQPAVSLATAAQAAAARVEVVEVAAGRAGAGYPEAQTAPERAAKKKAVAADEVAC